MSRPSKKKRTPRQALPWVAAAAVLVVAGLVLVGRVAAPGPKPKASSPTPVPYASGTSKGSPQAPLTIVNFSDFG